MMEWEVVLEQARGVALWSEALPLLPSEPLSSEPLPSTARSCCYPLLTWRMMQEEEEEEEEEPSSIPPLCKISLRFTPSSSHTHTSSAACYLSKAQSM